jgi:uncharacterized membrane protein
MPFGDARRVSPVRLSQALLFSALIVGLAACGDGSNSPVPVPEVEPSLEFVNVFQPVALTPDGSTALLQQYNATGEFYFYRTATGSLELMGEVGDASVSAVTGLSADGMVTGFFFTDSIRAGVWTQAEGWRALANTAFPAGCDLNVSSAWDVSADGATVVGMLWDECGVAAGRWDVASGAGTMLQRLGVGFSPDRDPDNRATRIADDGSLIGGWAATEFAGRYPALWRPDGSGFLLEGLPPEEGGEVMAISADGSMAAGYWGANAFYWTEATGAVSIGQLPSETDFAPAIGNAIAADNRLIFGVSGQPFFGTPSAFVWTAAGGMRPLADVVTAAGLTIPEGSTLTNVLAASEDGTVVLGQASDAEFNITSFVLKLPLSAYGL